MVQLVWVRGHIGIDDNNETDKQASRGASEPFLGPSPFVSLNGNTSTNL